MRGWYRRAVLVVPRGQFSSVVVFVSPDQAPDAKAARAAFDHSSRSSDCHTGEGGEWPAMDAKAD